MMLENTSEPVAGSRKEFEEFKLEFYEALLDLVEELRRIKRERQKKHPEEARPELIGVS